MRPLPAEPDYLDVNPDDPLAPGDLAGVAAWCLASFRHGGGVEGDWYRDLALALAAHFELVVPVVNALQGDAAADHIEDALVDAAHPGRSSVLRQLWTVRDRLLLLPTAWAGAASDPFGVALGDDGLERQVDELAGAIYAHADASLLLVRAIDRAIVALWCGDPARAVGRVTVRELLRASGMEPPPRG